VTVKPRLGQKGARAPAINFAWAKSPAGLAQPYPGMPQPATALVERWRGAVRTRALRPSEPVSDRKTRIRVRRRKNEVPASVVPPSACAAGGLDLVLELRWDFAAVFGEFDHDLFV
jgi:hypothetical protein